MVKVIDLEDENFAIKILLGNCKRKREVYLAMPFLSANFVTVAGNGVATKSAGISRMLSTVSVKFRLSVNTLFER